MFSRIAPRYDALNHLLSFNRDRRWRARAARLVDAGRHRVLDLATGTGDLAAALASPGRTVVGADFCVDMLARARRKEAGRYLSAGDALALPFPDAVFDAVTIAFGVRNFASSSLSRRGQPGRPIGSMPTGSFPASADSSRGARRPTAICIGRPSPGRAGKRSPGSFARRDSTTSSAGR